MSNKFKFITVYLILSLFFFILYHYIFPPSHIVLDGVLALFGGLNVLWIPTVSRWALNNE